MDIPPSIGNATYPISYFLGYRKSHPKDEQDPLLIAKGLRSGGLMRKVEYWVHTLVAAYVGLILVGLTSKANPFASRGAPDIIGAFGAMAVLLCITLSSLIGVGVARLFALRVPPGTFPSGYENDWAAAATAAALALLVCQILESPSAPGGAAAVIACTNPAAYHMGWMYVGYVLSETLVAVGWALIINNLGTRRYPQWWIHESMIPKAHGEEGDKEQSEA
ncbi:hypothetical protein FFLO_07169 [Filobasidium floriforme]|uniref:HPP transmembrane region domain-containing protein n=1 Tax=Filobasidium floriforme TaxID=5210 RepID=A0A8K0JE07_9TREE|nr:uncharacterized protein HD553DRAFT_340371 [Filobasidium floriforme]KAG7527202.1 hypothetical protein FFLO_07169 [Filobasidium floriforme]KAH8087212.1 hypothetical protein HD553DRAFT_340371 [Filobasidium floriforme]